LKIIIVNKKRTWKLRKKNESLSFFLACRIEWEKSCDIGTSSNITWLFSC
jgi:hypothetical protein